MTHESSHQCSPYLQQVQDRTAAWGRAIVALGFNTKKIASREEVRARTDGAAHTAPGDAASSPAGGVPTGSTGTELTLGADTGTGAGAGGFFAAVFWLG